MPKRTVLFVDDEPSLLDGLKRMLRRMRGEWDMEFVDSGVAALELMSRCPVDVIVTDMRMPGMNGAQLLETVRKLHPHVVRLILSGYSGQELILRSVGPAHQYLAKPCDADTLVAAIQHSCSLREFLDNQVVAQIVAKIDTLPVLPEIYKELTETLANERAPISEVGKIIAQDIGMTAKVLQLANSSFFGLRREVKSATQAVMYLGLDTVKTLVLSVSVFSEFDVGRMVAFSPEQIEHHSLRVGVMARQIVADHGGSSDMRNDAFTSGVLHDVGKLILAANFPTEYKEALEQSAATGIPEADRERDLIGATHSQLGAYLLGLWKLPDPIVEAVALHAHPELSLNPVFSALTSVYVANILDKDPAPALDMNYLESCGVADRVDTWIETADAAHAAVEAVSAGSSNG